MIFEITQTDDEDQFIWATRTRLLFDNGDGTSTLRRITTNFDDGFRREQHFEDSGNLAELILVDTDFENGRHMWERRETFFSEDGTLDTRLTLYDDGIEREESFDRSGQLSELMEQDRSEGGIAAPWSYRAFVFNPDGNLELSEIGLDNGVSRDFFFDTFNIPIIFLVDYRDAHPWGSIRTILGEDDEPTMRTTILDNRVVVRKEFESGVLVSLRSDDYSIGSNAVPWRSNDTTFNADGSFATRTRIQDDGVIVEDEFTDATSGDFSRTKIDSEDVRTFEFVEERYTDGELVSRLVELDNGVVRDEGYTNGILTFLSVEDQSADGSALPLERMELNFDSGGTLLTRDRFFDDGVVVRESFVNEGPVSVQLTREDVDDTKPFAFIEETYDQSGELAFQRVQNDDGLVVERVFTDGALTEERKLDLSADGSARDFGSRVERFDSEGRLIFSRVTIDDGDTYENRFENGIRVTRITDDDDNSSPWSRRTEFFDETGALDRVEFVDDASDLLL